MEKIVIKKLSDNIIKELDSVGFDKSYINNVENKYKGEAYKIFALRPYEANILKQMCLSLGFDCAVNRSTITCKCEYTDCIIFGSISQLEKLAEKLKRQTFRLKHVSEIVLSAINSKKEPLKIRNTVLDWSRPYIMGILNVTPDSFSDGGSYTELSAAYSRVCRMADDGADIIDIGGESTRPGAAYVSPEEEITRIIPVIKKIRSDKIDIPISIDTRNYITAKAAVEAGADIINDVSGLDYDQKLFNYVCENNIPTVIMHSDKIPAVSSDFADKDIIEQVYFSLYSKINKLINSGFDRNKIIADIGIGFGKSQESNFELIKRIKEFSSLNVPLLLGISRKSFMRNNFDIDFDEADIVTALYSAISKSADIHRVHNVKLTKQFIDYASKIN